MPNVWYNDENDKFSRQLRFSLIEILNERLKEEIKRVGNERFVWKQE